MDCEQLGAISKKLHPMTRVSDLERKELAQIFLKIGAFVQEYRDAPGGGIILATTDFLGMLPRGLRKTLLSRLYELKCGKKGKEDK